MSDDQVQWRGVGRWLSFAVAALWMLAAIPEIPANDAAAGWNIFLGLLLFGVIASGHRRAPLLVGILTALTVIRLVVALTIERNLVEAAGEALLFIALVFGWLDLRRQAALLDNEAPQQAT